MMGVLRYFWLRWKEGRVQVGEGSLVGQNLIMEHTKENPPEAIASIGISTGWLERGRWEISNVDGKLLSAFNCFISLLNAALFYSESKLKLK